MVIRNATLLQKVAGTMCHTFFFIFQSVSVRVCKILRW